MKQHNSAKNPPLTGNTEIQRYGSVVNRPIALEQKSRLTNCELLNQILADTMTLRDMYKKHHWQVSGSTFYQLHLLFDKHYGEQAELVDALAERIQTLGGVTIAMAHDVAETTRVERPPRGREDVSMQLFRLLQAHELIIAETREAAEKANQNGDIGTNDLLVSEVLRTNEFEVWFITEQMEGAGLREGAGERAAAKAHS
ncbi:MAG TPA: DNA starvation/stationary phase protection protein [Bryobacteraceae bacterium]|nr:DNA starvation/stationary phase protection protein [Bryobacteraceae bacterium]